MCSDASCAGRCATPSCIGARDPLMWRLVPALTREMGQAYPELLRAEALITETLKLEETRFRTTLARGLAILEEETRPLGSGGVLSGETAFKLYDTYGFPLDLTQDALRARGISVDVERLQRGHGASARRGAPRLGGIGRGGDRDGLVRLARADRRDRLPRLRDRDCRGGDPRDRQGRGRSRRSWKPAKRARSSSTRRRSTAKRAARSATSARSLDPASAPR